MMKAARQGIGLNPFYAVFCLYLFANLFALIQLGFGLPITVETQEMMFDGATVAISAVALFFSLFAALIVYRIALAMTKPRSDLVFGSWASLLLLLLQVGYLGFNTYYGVNIAGVSNEAQGNVLLRLMFSLTQPDLLFLIIAVGIKSNRWFWINAATYVISSLLRSWIGGLYLLAVIVAIRQHPISISWRNVGYFLAMLLAGVATLPLVVSAKWFLRSGASVALALDFLSDIGYFSYLVDSIAYVANRFQHLGHVALLAEKSRSLNEAYYANDFIPYWMDGAPQWLFLRLNEVDIFQLNRYVVREFFDSSNLAYSTNTGVAGWFFVLQYEMVVYVLFLLLITLPPAVIVFRYGGNRYFLLVSCSSLIYLFHGWIGAYVNLIVYLVALLLIKRFSAAPSTPARSGPGR